ncbi:hypothetical protein NP233_g4014 [Leucocoprinus birnbaumii]|uniref:Uncharacterized protein n=1 Tax=Leucocoprinus birnbaumii TaxID=56174 RepID=A0AAD5VWX0_9AGAR|nr:hypothetical protein NP233_g4014 [Leucocoprinus birnbaumii]
MVATRKKPSAPAPPTSRTNSSQALPRAVNAKPQSKSFASGNPSNLSQSSTKAIPNGAPQSKHATQSRKSSTKTPLARKEKRSLVDRLFFLFLCTFASYALYTCPSDNSHDYAVCRSLASYRRHVLEPYVIPAVHSAITHPAVIQPYEQYAKLVYQTYIQPVTPYVAAAHKRTAPYVNTAVKLSKQTSSRVWNNVITPYWSRAVVPRYTLYLEPHINKYVSPLIRRAKYYNQQAEPYVRSFAHHTSLYAHQAQKYASLAYNLTRPHVFHVYTAAKPYVVSGYARIKPLLFRIAGVAQSKGKYVASEVMVLSQIAVGRVGDLRREFVDPHVLRIWEKAVEKSGRSENEADASATTIGATVAPISSEVPIASEASHDPRVDVNVAETTVETAPEPTPIIESTTVEPIPSTIVASVTELAQEPEALEAPTPAPTPEETLEKAVSVAEASAAHASNVIADLESEILEAETAQVTIEPTPNPVEAPTPTPSETVIETTPEAPQVSSEETPEELDDFLRDIGLDEEEPIPEPEPAPQAAAPPVEDPEAKKAAIAAKRADIVGRHTRWRAELDSLVKNLQTRVKKDITKIREDAVTYIGKLSSDKTNSGPNGKAKEVIDKIQTEGEKLLKGLDAYVKKLTSRTIPLEELEKEKEKWEKIVNKVETRFKDVVRGVQEDVHSWYVQVRDKEVAVVLSAAAEAKSLAERAQADIGLDYAWLDDVTYHDWQNYHDLMRVAERFDETARTLQNGTHTETPADNLIPLLNTLDREVQNMIAGFAMQMNYLTRDGDRWLKEASEIQELEEDEEECEEYLDDEEEEPEVSILPIAPEPTTEHVDPANIVIGKSKEQVAQAAEQIILDQRVEL